MRYRLVLSLLATGLAGCGYSLDDTGDSGSVDREPESGVRGVHQANPLSKLYIAGGIASDAPDETFGGVSLGFNEVLCEACLAAAKSGTTDSWNDFCRDLKKGKAGFLEDFKGKCWGKAGDTPTEKKNWCYAVGNVCDD